MPIITFEDNHYDCLQNETILECLTRYGVFIPSSCQNGVCQTCLTKSVKGRPSIESQHGLKDTLVAQHYFLPCICKPEEDMELAAINVVQNEMKAIVVEKKALNGSVLRLRLRCDKPLAYIAGQFVNVKHPEIKLVRSYSLASLPNEDTLELHVKRVPAGQMSNCLHDNVSVGDSLSITGVAGDCFYTGKDLHQPLLMVAVGTGLAPLYGILRDALKHGHDGEIHILHASLSLHGLYYMDELQVLANQYKHVNYMPCVLHGDIPVGGSQGDVQVIVKAAFPKLSGWAIYVCGDPTLVSGLKQICFMAGASIADIYSDPFVFAGQ